MLKRLDIIKDILCEYLGIKSKKGDLSITQIVIMILAVVFLVISVGIIILSKNKAGGAIAYIKQLFSFG